MPPKRKAPISSSKGGGGGGGKAPTAAKAKGPFPPGSKRPELSKKKLKYRPPPQANKARVDVTIEDDAGQGSKGGKGKGRDVKDGPGPAKKQKVAPAPKQQPQKKEQQKKEAQPKKKKQLSFADEANDDEDAVPSAASSSALPSGPKSYQIICGSYEKLLYGLVASPPAEEDQAAEWTLKPVFIFPAHQACVKAVAASEGGKWLATGSTDEVVKIWDLRKRKEVGGLIQHHGSITSLVFPTRTHLVTASEDATLSLFRTRDWTLLRTFKGHTGRVNSVAVHPSGKVALSVGSDRTLRMWDLMRGKAGGATKLGKEGEVVRFSPSGGTLAVLSTNTLTLHSTHSMALACTLTNPKRFHDVHFLTLPSSTPAGPARELLVAPVEEGFTRVWERRGGAMGDLGVKEEEWVEIARFVGHSNRVKSVALVYPLLASISTDGFVHAYLLSSLPPSLSATESKEPAAVLEIAPCGKYDTKGTRLTCVTMSEVAPVRAPRPAGEEEDDDEEEEEAWGGIGSDAGSGGEEDEDEEDMDAEEGLSGEEGDEFSGDEMEDEEDELEGEMEGEDED